MKFWNISRKADPHKQSRKCLRKMFAVGRQKPDAIPTLNGKIGKERQLHTIYISKINYDEFIAKATEVARVQKMITLDAPFRNLFLVPLLPKPLFFFAISPRVNTGATWAKVILLLARSQL